MFILFVAVQQTTYRTGKLGISLGIWLRPDQLFVVLGLRCLLDCHVLKGFGIYMIGILDRLY